MNRRIIYCSLALLCLYFKVGFGQIIHQMEFPSILKIETEILEDSVEYNRIILPETCTMDSLGYPSLPVKYIKLIVPFDAIEFKVKAKTTQKQKIDLIKKVAPQPQNKITEVEQMKNM